MEYLKEQILYLFKSNWHAIISAIVLVSSTFFIVGLLFLVLSGFLDISQRYFNQYYYSFMIKEHANSTLIEELQDQLELLNPITLEYVSKSQLTDDLFKSFNTEDSLFDKELINFSGSIDFVLVNPTSEMQNKVNLFAKNQIVADVVSNKSLTTELLKFFSILANVMNFLIVLVLFGAALSIYIVIQLLIYYNSKEISIVRSLGGKKLFILRPFLIIAGLISSFSYFVAIGFSFLFFNYINNFFDIVGLNNYLPSSFNFFSWQEIYRFFLLVLGLGLFSSYFAGYRVLKLIDRL